jgi:hypothetical protein
MYAKTPRVLTLHICTIVKCQRRALVLKLHSESHSKPLSQSSQDTRSQGAKASEDACEGLMVFILRICRLPRLASHRVRGDIMIERSQPGGAENLCSIFSTCRLGVAMALPYHYRLFQKSNRNLAQVSRDWSDLPHCSRVCVTILSGRKSSEILTS